MGVIGSTFKIFLTASGVLIVEVDLPEHRWLVAASRPRSRSTGIC